MSLEEIKIKCKNVKVVAIDKDPNSFGNYKFRFYDGNSWIIGCFKTFDDAVTFFFFEGFVNESHTLKKIIMSRD